MGMSDDDAGYVVRFLLFGRHEHNFKVHRIHGVTCNFHENESDSSSMFFRVMHRSCAPFVRLMCPVIGWTRH